jgi:ADP-heptose:LPS heptosyltransferase
MEKVLDCLPRAAKVAIVRLRSLGDCVLTTPAIELLRLYRPDLQVGVVVENRFAPVFEGNPNVNRLFSPHLPPLMSWRPRLCVNFHGGTRSLILTEFSGAEATAGFAHYRAAWAYSIRIPRAQEILGVDRKVHTAEHLASAMFHMGVPQAEVPRARLYAEFQPAEKPYAVLHPVASAPDKTWNAAGFLEVARHLRSNGLDAVFIGGPGDDLSAFSEFRTALGAPLSETKTLLRNASLFIGNDSGPAHMAAAFGIPLAVIFGASDHVVWAPWRVRSEMIIADGPISEVKTLQVIEALDRLRVTA